MRCVCCGFGTISTYFRMPFRCVSTFRGVSASIPMPFPCFLVPCSMSFQCVSDIFPCLFNVFLMFLFAAFPMWFPCISVPFPACFRRASVAFLMRFRCFSVTFPMHLRCVFDAVPKSSRYVFTHALNRQSLSIREDRYPLSGSSWNPDQKFDSRKTFSCTNMETPAKCSRVSSLKLVLRSHVLKLSSF